MLVRADSSLIEGNCHPPCQTALWPARPKGVLTRLCIETLAALQSKERALGDVHTRKVKLVVPTGSETEPRAKEHVGGVGDDSGWSTQERLCFSASSVGAAVSVMRARACGSPANSR